jgi:hypothetical protein
MLWSTNEKTPPQDVETGFLDLLNNGYFETANFSLILADLP